MPGRRRMRRGELRISVGERSTGAITPECRRTSGLEKTQFKIDHNTHIYTPGGGEKALSKSRARARACAALSRGRVRVRVGAWVYVRTCVRAPARLNIG
jgi:hypothetical protein